MPSAGLRIRFVSSVDNCGTQGHAHKRGSVAGSRCSRIDERACDRRHCTFCIRDVGISGKINIKRANVLITKMILNEKQSFVTRYTPKKRPGIPASAGCVDYLFPSHRVQTRIRTECYVSIPGTSEVAKIYRVRAGRHQLAKNFGSWFRYSALQREGRSDVGNPRISFPQREIMARSIKSSCNKAQSRTESADSYHARPRTMLRAVADDRANLKDEEGEGGESEQSAVEDGMTGRKLENRVSSRKALRSFAATAIQDSLPPEGFAVLMSCAVGLMTGAGVVVFNLAVHGIHDVVFKGIPSSGAAWLRDQPLEEIWQQIVFVPIGGGVVVGLLNTIRLSLGGSKEEQAGTGDSSSIWTNVKAVARQLLKTLGAAVTLGTGNSLGPEGPSVEIGASIASGFGTLLRNSRERKLSLVASGSAAGLSSGFNAAVAGCFFAVESVLRQASVDSSPSLTTAMVLLSSVLASVVSQAGLGSDPAFRIPPYDFRSPTELPLYLLLGVLCGLVSVTLTKGSAYATTWFEWLQKTTGLPPGFLPPLGGLCVGLVALRYPEVLYFGFANVDVLLESRLPWVKGPPAMLLLQLVGAKVVTTSICRGSGLVGGVYAPSLFIGAALGSAYGKLATYALTHADPRLHLDSLDVAAPQAYALVGMAAMLAGVCQVPLTAVLLLFELTRDYRIILPLMAAVGLSSWIASTFQRKKPRDVLRGSPTLSSDQVVALTRISGDQKSQPVLLEVESKELEQSNSTVLLRGYVSKSQDLCDLEDSLCLANLEVNEERLTDEIPVGAAMRTRYAAVAGNVSVHEATTIMLVEKEWCVVVVNDENRLEGILTLADIQQQAEKAKRKGTEEELFQRPISDLWKSLAGGKSKVVTVYPDMSLSDAKRRMARRGLRQLPVIARTPESQGKQLGSHVLGLLDRESIKLACRVEATRRMLGLPATTLRSTFPDDTNVSS